jgi:predicted transcriptional regulator
MSWEERLLPLLTDEWQPVGSIANKIEESRFTVLARLKDLMRQDLAERRIVHIKSASGRSSTQEAQFRRKSRPKP